MLQEFLEKISKVHFELIGDIKLINAKQVVNTAIFNQEFFENFDVDAVYIKISDLVKDGDLLAEVGVITITIAVIMNTLVKAFYIKLGASAYLGKLMTMLISLICLVGIIVTGFVVL